MQDIEPMGTKLVCDKCGCRFYDMGRDSAVCPKCGTIVEAVSGAGATKRRAASEKESSRTDSPFEPDSAGLGEAAAEDGRQGGGTDEVGFSEEEGTGKNTLDDDDDEEDDDEDNEDDKEDEDLDEEMMVDEEDGEEQSEEDSDDEDNEDESGDGGEDSEEEEKS